MKLADICVPCEMPVIQVMRRLDATGKRILLILQNEKLAGVLTDGDIRRWIIHNGSLEAPISNVMHKSPKFVYETEQERANTLIEKYKLEAVPILNINNEPVNIVFRDSDITLQARAVELTTAPVVIMAGGKGTRLYPYTKVLPKPLIPIGDNTILERVMDSFQRYGAQDFYLVLNYKKELIKAYLADFQERFCCHYLEEKTYLGTAGGLSLLRGLIDVPFFISNCDIVLDVNYTKLMAYHKNSNNLLTVVTTLKHFQIPYGVTQTNDKGQIIAMQEKPELYYQINTGVYVASPCLLDRIPENACLQMPQLIEKVVHQGGSVGIYPIIESAWQDMGEMNKLDKMIDLVNGHGR